MFHIGRYWICGVFILCATALGEEDSSKAWAEKMKQLYDYVQANDIEETGKGAPGAVGLKDLNRKMNCPVEPSMEKPTSVHALRPQDINVVGAMGDSLTAGNGANATSVKGILREYRGLSWSSGGEGDAESSLTLPNILRTFNPNLKGFSVGIRFGDDRDWGFNVAVPGSRARDMPRQAKLLIEKMQEDPDVNFDEDWKLVTVFIGGNDLCAIRRSAAAQPEEYIGYLKEGLDVLHAGMKKTLVNLVNILEIHLLPEVANGYGSTRECRIAQKTLCNYVATADEEDLENIKNINSQYQDLINSLIKSGRYDTRDDFTIVVQPFLQDTALPYTEDGQVDSSYFAPDCFHFSTKGHAMGALNLWNNMLEPVGQKTTEWLLGDLKCPEETSPYIFTSKNSLLRSASMVAEPMSASSNDMCNENVTEVWIIVVICILSVIVLVQTLFLSALLVDRSKNYGKNVLVN